MPGPARCVASLHSDPNLDGPRSALGVPLASEGFDRDAFSDLPAHYGTGRKDVQAAKRARRSLS